MGSAFLKVVGALGVPALVAAGIGSLTIPVGDPSTSQRPLEAASPLQSSPQPSPDPSFERCLEVQDQQTCLEEYVAEVAAAKGVEAALTAVDALGVVDPGLLSRCHDLKHEVGRAAFGLGGGDLLQVLRFDDLACQYGFRHGVFEAFSIVADDMMLAEAFDTACTIYSDAGVTALDRAREMGECMHSLGHAAAVAVPDDYVAAVGLCISHLDTPDQAAECAGGALMEYVNSFQIARTGEAPSETHGPGTASLNDAEALDLCAGLGEVPDAVLGECWSRVGPLWRLLLDDDPQAMTQRCLDTAGTFLDRCAYSLGEAFTALAYTKVRDFYGDIAPYVGQWCRQDLSVEPFCLGGSVFVIRGNEMWMDIPVSSWKPICEQASTEAAFDSCRDVEMWVIGNFPDPGRRQQFLAARNFPTSS